ncbi:MAG TPA: hypothetical protein EYG21_02005 [Nitrospinaceae bacterium]|jgi:hypothetical protein|nr:hypothetical protein [Nitrospinaceae bacterium]
MDMTFKKLIFSIIAACFLTLSAGNTFGGNEVLVVFEGADGNEYKLKIDTDNGKFFVKDKTRKEILCKRWIMDTGEVPSFITCVISSLVPLGVSAQKVIDQGVDIVTYCVSWRREHDQVYGARRGIVC